MFIHSFQYLFDLLKLLTTHQILVLLVYEFVLDDILHQKLILKKVKVIYLHNFHQSQPLFRNYWNPFQVNYRRYLYCILFT